jgi:VanZ family protein
MVEKSDRWQYIYFHLPWQIMVVVLFILSSISGEELSQYTFAISDKLIHFLVFGILGILMFRSFSVSLRTGIRKNAIILAIVLASIYGAIDEIHQLYVPGRFASVGDWLADTLGIIVMVLIYNGFIRMFFKNQNTGNLDNTGR